MSAPIDKILPRLQVVRELKSNKHAARYLVRCPGPLHEHGDRTPSAIVTVTHDDSLLLWCNAGCGAAEIVEAVGFQLADLFPDRPEEHRGDGNVTPRLSPRDALTIIKHEVTVCACVMGRLLNGDEVSRQDVKRAAEAHRRIMRTTGAAYGA